MTDAEIATLLDRAVYFLDEDVWPTLNYESKRKSDECSRVSASLEQAALAMRARLKHRRWCKSMLECTCRGYDENGDPLPVTSSPPTDSK